MADVSGNNGGGIGSGENGCGKQHAVNIVIATSACQILKFQN